MPVIVDHIVEQCCNNKWKQFIPPHPYLDDWVPSAVYAPIIFECHLDGRAKYADSCVPHLETEQISLNLECILVLASR